MQNRYPGTCYRCGENVAAGEGNFEFDDFPGSRWPQLRMTRNHPLVQHAACAVKYRGTNTHYIYLPDAADDFQVIEPE